MEPLVSVILTLYEIKLEYLNECLNSLLNQTYKNIEIIAINDCSPITNYDYITEISPKIRYFKNETNLKMNKTVNKAFKLARGKYIVRMGSDDFFDPSLFEKEVNILEGNSELGAVCCGLKRFGRKSQYITRPIKWDLKHILLNKDIHGCGYAGGMMFRADLLPDISINENYKMCEDLDFHLQILEKAPIQSIQEFLYYYRAHDTNLCKSVKTKERLEINKTILEEHLEKYKKNKALDFVYIVKESEDNNELRYSLRSIAKFYPENKVWIVGYKPSWVQNVNYIPVKQDNGSKWKNSVNNIIKACESKEISDDFILMNDDFFIIKKEMPLNEICNINLGSLDKNIEIFGKCSGNWFKAFAQLKSLLQELGIKEPYYSYEAHLPLLINKQKYLEVMHLPQVIKFMRTSNVLHKRSLYKNIIKPDNSKELEHDVKVHKKDDDIVARLSLCGWISVYDNQIYNEKFPKLNFVLKDTFPTPCKYEKIAGTNNKHNSSNDRFLKF